MCVEDQIEDEVSGRDGEEGGKRKGERRGEGERDSTGEGGKEIERNEERIRQVSIFINTGIVQRALKSHCSAPRCLVIINSAYP